MAEEWLSIAPQAPLTAIDTTGAGDSFNASYLASRLLGELPSVSVKEAHSTAAKVISAHGALVPLDDDCFVASSPASVSKRFLETSDAEGTLRQQ